jgi:hypothetical protein
MLHDFVALLEQEIEAWHICPIIKKAKETGSIKGLFVPCIK